MKLLTLFLALSVLMPASHGQTPARKADAIFVNGNVYTVATPARAEAIAVRGDRIAAVGTNAEVQKLKGKNTRVVDLGGRFVMPGFNDAHLHLASGGLAKLRVDLVGAKSLAEMKSRIAERARLMPPGEWLTGRGWDHTLWSDQKLPSRQDIDAVTGERPALFVRVDGHIGVANSAALKAAGIGDQTPDPPGGKIDRDDAGAPTGIVRETALAAVQSKVPPPSPAQRRRGIELALAEAAHWGLTSLQDNSQWADFLVYEELAREGKLTARISEWLPFEQPLPTLQRHRARRSQKDPLLHTGMLKGFMDGSLGSGTAALLAPYNDNPQSSGIPRLARGKLNATAVERTRAGFQIGLHAIGDRGVEMALDAFAEALRDARERGTTHAFRFRVEHAQVVTPSQFSRFRELAVVVSMQPNHLLTDMNWAVARIGKERAKHSYPWAEFLKNGVRLAFGTDYPVEPITPFRGLYAALTRRNEAGTAEYFPEQRLTIAQALAAYTTGSAYAEFAEQEKGTLEVGKLADFVVLDRDLTKATPAEVLQTKVLRTVVGGRTVYEAK